MTGNWRHDYAFVNGIRMHYVEQGEGPLVLLCHGWPESWYSWRHQIPTLADTGFRVVAPDLRGYGDTEKPLEVEAYDVLTLASDLVALVNALGEEHAILVGHDWGSMLAATASLLRPDMFRALALLSVPFMPRRRIRPAAQFHTLTQERHFYQDYFQPIGRIESEVEADMHRAMLGILYTGSAACREHPEHRRKGFITFEKSTRFVDNLAIPESLPSWLTNEDLETFVDQFSRGGFAGPINWYRNIDRNWTLTAFLDGARIQQPTMFAAGESDGVIRMAKMEYETLEINVPKLWKKTLIRHAGHWLQQEQPHETSQLLIEFLQQPQVISQLS
ncbi:Alpha/beta hydrolase [Cupriavidus taiwanensis]|nr:Alpha/beta hydrolase [Cupriavidus taiwanensis]